MLTINRGYFRSLQRPFTLSETGADYFDVLYNASLRIEHPPMMRWLAKAIDKGYTVNGNTGFLKAVGKLFPFCPKHGRASRPITIEGLRCDCGR